MQDEHVDTRLACSSSVVAETHGINWKAYFSFFPLRARVLVGLRATQTGREATHHRQPMHYSNRSKYTHTNTHTQLLATYAGAYTNGMDIVENGDTYNRYTRATATVRVCVSLASYTSTTILRNKTHLIGARSNRHTYVHTELLYYASCSLELRGN